MSRSIIRNNNHLPGQAIVEFALTIPIMLLLIMLTVDFGRAIWYYNAIANAAREGARYGIVKSHSDAEIINTVLQKSTGVPLSNSNITITRSGTSPNGSIKVSISYNFRPITPLVSNLIPGGEINLKASSEMSLEQ